MANHYNELLNENSNYVSLRDQRSNNAKKKSGYIVCNRLTFSAPPTVSISNQLIADIEKMAQLAEILEVKPFSLNNAMFNGAAAYGV